MHDTVAKFNELVAQGKPKNEFASLGESGTQEIVSAKKSLNKNLVSSPRRNRCLWLLHAEVLFGCVPSFIGVTSELSGLSSAIRQASLIKDQTP